MKTTINKQWIENNYKLKKYFSLNNQDEYDRYFLIVKKLFEICFDDILETNELDLSAMTTLNVTNEENYLKFIIPIKSSENSQKKYMYTSIYSGDCSWSDPLQAISLYGYEKPNKQQINQYMHIANQLVENIKEYELKTGIQYYS